MRDFNGFYADVVIFLFTTANIPLWEISRRSNISLLRLLMIKYRIREPFVSDVYDLQKALDISDEELENIVENIRNNKINQNIHQ